MSVLFLLLLAAVAALLQWLSLRHCLDGLSCDLTISRRAVECGERFQLISTVTNTRRLPVLFLRLSERIPGELNVELERTGVRREDRLMPSGNRAASLEQTLYIMPRQKVTRTMDAQLPARGRYLFRGSRLTAGDLLGLRERQADFPRFREVVVLPPRVDLAELDSAFGNYLGDISVRRFILSDPRLTVGFREYTGREPQRDISWPRSLRDGRLMVKQYDYTAELTVTVILNISFGTQSEIERAYSLARVVCERLEERRISYSFATNACMTSAAGAWSYLGDGLGGHHLNTIVECLGAANYDCMFPLKRLLDRAARREENRGYLLITPPLAADGTALVRSFEHETGQRVLVIPAEGADREVPV